MSNPLEVSYDVAEVDGLTEAHAILSRLSMQTAHCLPAWTKLYHAGNYIHQRQKDVLAETLSPEAA